MAKSGSTIAVRIFTAAGFAVFSLSLALRGDVTPATQAVTTQPAATAGAASDVDQLINQLGSENPQDQDAAQQKLAAMGPAAIPALKKAAADNDDPEIRSRAGTVLSQMKEHDTDDASLITMHNKEANAQVVLDEIGRQAHAQFVSYPGGGPGMANRTLTVDADKKPFWEVMSDVCAQLGVCPIPDATGKNSMRLLSTGRSWIAQSPHKIVGPYWVSVSQIARTRTIDLNGPQTVDDQFAIRVIVYPEPKLAVTQMSALILKEATDDKGNSLLPKAQAANGQAAMMMLAARMVRSSRMSTYNAESQLFYPENPGTKIAVLRGEVTVQLAQDLQKFEVDDVLGTPKMTNPLPHCKVTAEVPRSATDIYRVNITCTREGLSNDQWTAMINRMSDIVLEDADGRPLSSMGIGMPAASPDSTSFTGQCVFSRSPMGLAMIRVGGAAPAGGLAAKTGEPKKLTWNVPTTIKSVVVPVEFKDLPMP